MTTRSRARAMRSARARLRCRPWGTGGNTWIRSALRLSVRLLILAALANNWGGVTEAAASQVHHQVQRLSEVAIDSYISSLTAQTRGLATP